MILFAIQTTLWNDCMYDDWCPRLHEVRFRPLHSESCAVCAPRLWRQEVVLRLTSGPARAQRHGAPQSVMFSILSMWKGKTTSARLWHYLLSRVIFETQTRPHTCHVFHGVTFMMIESAQYMILQQQKKKKAQTNCHQMQSSEDKGWNNEGLLPVSAENSLMLMLILWHGIELLKNYYYFLWLNNCSPSEKDNHAVV